MDNLINIIGAIWLAVTTTVTMMATVNYFGDRKDEKEKEKEIERWHLIIDIAEEVENRIMITNIQNDKKKDDFASIPTKKESAR